MGHVRSHRGQRMGHGGHLVEDRGHDHRRIAPTASSLGCQGVGDVGGHGGE